MRTKHLETNRDRHGNVRYYVRKDGKRLGRIRAKYGSAEFHAEFARLLDQPISNPKEKVVSGSLAWLCQQYYGSAAYKGLGASTRKRRRSILDRICKKLGTGQFRNLEGRHVRAERDLKADTPEAANADIKALRGVFSWAVEAGIAQRDPTAGIKKLRPRNADGFHTWTEAEVEAFEAKYSIGTKARLALDLLLYTGVRKSDVVKLGPQMERPDGLHFVETKGRDKTPKHRVIPILPALRKSIDAAKSGHLAYLVTDFGKPFSVGGFGNKMREWCDNAGLPVCAAHGLRKAGATRVADAGGTAHQLMALFGWTTLAQAEVYTRRADRKRLTAEAVALLQIGNDSATLSGGVAQGAATPASKRLK